jgi:hypothetical protein
MPIAATLFALDPRIRYVAVNLGGRVVEMAQSPDWPSTNPSDTDRMEELIVNPAVLDLVRRRGEIDLGGARYVLIRYGVLFQLVLPYRGGHVSVGIEPGPGILEIAERCEEAVRSIPG